MSDEERDLERDTAEDPGPAPTPFDHPFFLPVVVTGFAIWFAVDVILQREAFQKYPEFNIGGLVITSVLSIWFWVRGWREWRAPKEAEPSSE